MRETLITCKALAYAISTINSLDPMFREENDAAEMLEIWRRLMPNQQHRDVLLLGVQEKIELGRAA